MITFVVFASSVIQQTNLFTNIEVLTNVMFNLGKQILEKPFGVLSNFLCFGLFSRELSECPSQGLCRY